MIQNPTQGGSYRADPVTGELTRVEWTRDPREAPEPSEAEPVPAADTPELPTQE